jgi:hypothetical protein
MVDGGDGCSYYILTINVFEGVLLGGGAPSSALAGFGWWDQYNCDGTFVWTDGTITSAKLTAGSASASIVATVELVDWFTREPLGSMDVDLTLTGDGTSSRGINNNSYSAGGGFVRSRSVGTNYFGTGSGTAHGATISGAWAMWGSSTSGTVTKYSW